MLKRSALSTRLLQITGPLGRGWHYQCFRTAVASLLTGVSSMHKAITITPLALLPLLHTTMRTILILATCAGLTSAMAAVAPKSDRRPLEVAAVFQDKGYDKADPYAMAYAVRTIDFSGYAWWVKTSSGRVGPGPNYFSDSPNNVWVDESGFLHLKITKVKNRWYCAEIVSTEVFGHGTYQWELASPVDNLDRNVVLGLFTWSDTSEYAYGEIDIEFSRWGSRNLYPNAQFVVQPFDAEGHLVRFTMPPGVPESTHSFLWAPEGVIFQSVSGHWLTEPSPEAVVFEWAFMSPWPPPTGTENARLNLWLYQGASPSNRQEVEVVFKSFAFVPYLQQ